MPTKFQDQWAEVLLFPESSTDDFTDKIDQLNKNLENKYRQLLIKSAQKVKHGFRADGQEVPAASIFGKYNYITVCREIEKTDLDTQGKPSDSSTYSTGTGTFPDKPSDSSTYNNRLQDHLGSRRCPAPGTFWLIKS